MKVTSIIYFLIMEENFILTKRTVTIIREEKEIQILKNICLNTFEKEKDPLFHCSLSTSIQQP